MSENLSEKYDGQWDDPPPSYSLVAQQEPGSYPSSIFHIFSLNVDPPPSYSSLDLAGSTSDLPPPVNQTTQSGYVHQSPNNMEVTRKPRGCEVPSYIVWSIVSSIIFPPVGLIALIFSLKVCIAWKRNNAKEAWKSHVIARKINLCATFLGIMAVLYIAITIPLKLFGVGRI